MLVRRLETVGGDQFMVCIRYSSLSTPTGLEGPNHASAKIKKSSSFVRRLLFGVIEPNTIDMPLPRA